MSRIQLALNVTKFDEAVDFYTKLFGVGPAKLREGYANFAITEPPLKLILIESTNAGGSINHLGVEVESPEEVGAATKRLSAEGMATDVEESVDCCYAVQDKVWVSGPDGERWEVYTVLADTNTQDVLPSKVGSCACEPVSVGAGSAAEQSPCC